MNLLRAMSLRGIGAQMAALVVVSIVALHVILTVSFLIHRPDQPEPPDRWHTQLSAAAQLLGTAPAAERPRLMADIARAFPQLEIETLAANPTGLIELEPQSLHALRRLDPSYHVYLLQQGGTAPNEGEIRRVAVRLPDGAMLSAKLMPDRPPRSFWGGPWMMTVMFAVISVTLLGLWAAWALTTPLSSFVKAAESFSLNGAAAPLPERGPEEIRSMARALNRMRERITNLMDDRTKMLAAISHDLRTPITRMRLRAEFIEDETHRHRMLRDLDQMRSMLESVLSFLRNDRRLEAMTLVDIASTLQLVTDQFADMGHKVAYEGPEHAMATARPDDLHRSVTNLLENAVRFGGEATVRLTATRERLTIDIEDDGPGISDLHKANVLEPFVRGDDARNQDEAVGFGRVLSIANAIVLAHHGTLSLHDREPHGLIVRIELPARQQLQKSAA
jgi:signal transduction histidine kinase